ncbi:MAG: hypothetical protein WCK77_14175 [Verrucomicrobiota bacterium]
MKPYLRAFAEYGKAERGMSWTEALDWHFQVGAVVSTPEFFAMLRPVELRWSDEAHHSVLLPAEAGSSTWHVWALAGDLGAALAMAAGYGVEWVTFQRHGGERVHRVAVAALVRKCAG